MDTARSAYPPAQLVPIDHSECWIEPCRTCRELEDALYRAGFNRRSARFWREAWMLPPLRAEEFRSLTRPAKPPAAIATRAPTRIAGHD